MPRYEVSATISMSADSFEYDSGTATVEFNVSPAVALL